jgi:uncharacterized membrane protein
VRSEGVRECQAWGIHGGVGGGGGVGVAAVVVAVAVARIGVLTAREDALEGEARRAKQVLDRLVGVELGSLLAEVCH